MSSSLCYSVLTTLLLLILSVITSSTAIPEDKYGLKGGSIELSVKPQPTETVTSIIWKHKRDKAAEWFEEDHVPNATYYGGFTSRTVLDMSTWSLTIRDLLPILQGEYSAEVNNKDPTQSWNLIIIEAVREPTIKDVCNSINCTLTCEGAGDPHSEYTWYDAGGQEISTKPEITVQRKDQDMDYTCKLSNPVSHSNSSVKVPCLVDSSHYGATGGLMVVYICVGVVAGVVSVTGLILYIWRQRRRDRHSKDYANAPVFTIYDTIQGDFPQPAVYPPLPPRLTPTI